MSLINYAKVIELDLKTVNQTGAISYENNLSIFKDNNISDSSKSFLTDLKIDTEDNLIIIATDGKIDSNYLGGWNIENVNDYNLTLFETSTNLSNEVNLSYIIGDEVRLLGNDIVLADVDYVDNETTTDENGDIFFDVKFDPPLAGHTLTLEAHGTLDINSSDSKHRVGISKIDGFRYENINAESKVLEDIATATDIVVTLVATIDGIYPLVNLALVPDSFKAVASAVDASCYINKATTNFKTDNFGRVDIILNTTKGSEKSDCTISWVGGMNSIYSEY